MKKVQKDEEQQQQNVVLSNLYQKPAESLSKMTPSELRILYQSVLQCVLFPLTQFTKPDSELQSILAEFSINNYTVLKKLFNMDDSDHATLLTSAMQQNTVTFHSCVTNRPVYHSIPYERAGERRKI